MLLVLVLVSVLLLLLVAPLLLMALLLLMASLLLIPLTPPLLRSGNGNIPSESIEPPDANPQSAGGVCMNLKLLLLTEEEVFCSGNVSISGVVEGNNVVCDEDFVD